MKLNNNYFPLQRVSNSEKDKPIWYENCIDYIISLGCSMNDKTEINAKLSILHGDIPNEFYKKTINPYNSKKEKFTRFPATMRNLDIMNDVVRRYISEYIKGIHEFIVSANDSEIVLRKDAKLQQAVNLLAQQTFVTQFQVKLQEQIAQGVPQEQINPQELMPNIDQFIKDFNEDYIDEISKQGQDLIKVIDDLTDSDTIYPKAYFDFISLGECYSYRDVRNGKFFKEIVPAIEAYPIPNANHFVEDHDMFARCQRLSYQQIMSTYANELTDKDREFLRRCYAEDNYSTGPVTRLGWQGYFETYPESCDKFSNEERKLFKTQSNIISDINTELIEVWHVVWNGECQVAIVTGINQSGFIEERIEDSDYILNKELGDISIKYEYKQQTYEGVRIGSTRFSIYPIKARAICYNRINKLPYNGVLEVLPGLGKFSIIDIISPFQILRNIISYHREMVIARNKMLILLMPESLLGSGSDDTEDKIYKMAADGLLAYDDSEDSNNQKAAQIRLLNANLSGYIGELTALMETIKQEARELVDMTPQRYGDIAQSAGRGTTQEAIIRGSMGSVIIVYMFDKFRERDYQADMDFTKFAWIDGLDTAISDTDGRPKYISLDVNAHTNADYLIKAKNNAIESDKLKQMQEWAFSAAQNGDLDMAMAAITNNNISSMKIAINNFMELKRKHEDSLQQAQQELEEFKVVNKLKEIVAKGEEDRKTEELKALLEQQSKYVDINFELSKLQGESANNAKASLEANRSDIDTKKIQLEKEKETNKIYNDAANRNIQREKIAADERIAKTNRNKYSK